MSDDDPFGGKAHETGEPKRAEYLAQHGTACVPIGMCNALRWWGLPSPEPETDAWRLMVELAGCQDGDGTVAAARVADWLGLVRRPTSVDWVMQHRGALPVLFGVRDPEAGLHAALAVEAAPEVGRLTFVNLRPRGPLVETVSVADVVFDTAELDDAEGWWLVPRWPLIHAANR